MLTPMERYIPPQLVPEDSPESRRVLVVEDEPTTMRFYATGLKGLQAHGWRILSAVNGADAVEVLKREAIDVLVTDLNMPVMDGYRLIAHVHERYPSLPVIVLTSLPTGEPQDRARALGALRVASKPVRLSYLMEEIRHAGDLKPEGHVRGLSLGGLLQLMAWEDKTATLKVRMGMRQGHLYILSGRLIHAELGIEEGLPAALDILSWERPEVDFTDDCRVTEGTINLAIPEILMQVALREDNLRRGLPEEAPPPPVVRRSDGHEEA